MSNSTLSMLEKTLHYTSVKQKVINKNIANANTEEYLREEVTFSDSMSDAMAGQLRMNNPKHMAPVSNSAGDGLVIKQDEELDDNNGINNVTIEREMSDMAENQILFRFAAKRLSGYFRTMQDVIKGSRSQ